ncbi:DUF2971 domain-containing protein [Burkholderia multivorans]|uniref:DUF2971 domain-containing protein n=1 Tax=Burkholderia multivorans TaxID=87883 RepID=UPI000D003E05|nr:DUF2971 domain-containing protein [Burkholderia multivorans]MDN7995939.1 DUF2971 domain-containing protein [Burkholderia multivorans]PRH00992.1 hypothetical protein C6T61_25475 [Burkholderia multivorans]
MTISENPVSKVSGEQEIHDAVSAKMWGDFTKYGDFPESRPLLAHYTSIETLNEIVTNREMWFSNPLYMNDFEELRFGMNEATQAFFASEAVRKACADDERYNALCSAYAHYFKEFDEKHAFDTYITCLSLHSESDVDGRLSMWRGYGGNGKGAAIVFDSSQLNHVENSPLVIARVEYASSQDRREWIGAKLNELAQCIEGMAIPSDKLYLAAHAFFERVKMFSLFTKHIGFEEEREWRVAYMSERDTGSRLKHLLSYTVGRNGIEPKLKLKFEPLEGVFAENNSLSTLVHQIILGPSMSSPLAVKAVKRMLEQVGLPELCDRVRASSTPYRG